MVYLLLRKKHDSYYYPNSKFIWKYKNMLETTNQTLFLSYSHWNHHEIPLNHHFPMVILSLTTQNPYKYPINPHKPSIKSHKNHHINPHKSPCSCGLDHHFWIINHWSLEVVCLLLLLLQQGDAIRQELRIEFGLERVVEGKPWENHRKTMGKWWLNMVSWGFYGI